MSDTDLEIKSVCFLTPAKVKVNKNGKEEILMLSIDLLNRKAYLQDGDDSLSDLIFQHIDEVNTVPSDFFSPPEEVLEEAARAQMKKDEIIEQAFSGATNE